MKYFLLVCTSLLFTCSHEEQEGKIAFPPYSNLFPRGQLESAMNLPSCFSSLSSWNQRIKWDISNHFGSLQKKPLDKQLLAFELAILENFEESEDLPIDVFNETVQVDTHKMYDTGSL